MEEEGSTRTLPKTVVLGARAPGDGLVMVVGKNEEDDRPRLTAEAMDAEAHRMADVLAGMGARLVLLFGSRARGEEPGPDSDLDIVAVIEAEAGNSGDRSRWWARVHSALEPRVHTDLLLYTPEEFGLAREYNPLVRTALLEGVILHGSLEAAGPPRWLGVAEEGGTPGDLSDEELPDIKELDAGVWIDRAKEDLSACEFNKTGGYYALACFLAQQTVEKALKAFLYLNGHARVKTHSVVYLASEATAIDRSFGPFREAVKSLEGFYTNTRYPNGVRHRDLPSEVFDREKADAAQEVARSVMDWVVPKLGKIGQFGAGGPDKSGR